MATSLIQIISAIAIATVSSWTTVQLSLKRFRSERWWEKKAEAYERVIEAFHNSKKFDSEHMRAVERGSEVPNDRDQELRKLSKAARDEILRAADIGGFVMSEGAMKILSRYEAESENAPREPSWYEHLDASWSLTNSYMKEFFAEAHRDLRE